MYKRIRHLLTALLMLLFVSTTFSQIKTYSPYTRYGLGEFNLSGFGRNSAMGGTGIGIRTSQHLNNLNPASYSAIDSMSFFFETGVSSNTRTLISGDTSESFSDMHLDYFAFGFPITNRIAFSMGLKPAANAGYQFELIQNQDTDPTLYTAKGDGNISSVYGGLSYKITPEFHAGFHASYWFGNLTHYVYQEFLTDPNAFKYGMMTNHRVNSLILDFGVQYTKPLSNNKNLILGAVFRPTTNIKGETSFITARGLEYNNQGRLFNVNDTIDSAISDWSNSPFDLPMSIGFGASYVVTNKLTVAADFMVQPWADAQFPDKNTETANTRFMAAGAEYIPNERTGTRYFQRIRYRAGIHYHEDYIKVDGHQLKDFGMSFGLGLPLKRTNTTVNLGFEYGSRGPGQSDLLKETYSRFTLNFTMHEFWFMKRRFE